MRKRCWSCAKPRGQPSYVCVHMCMPMYCVYTLTLVLSIETKQKELKKSMRTKNYNKEERKKCMNENSNEEGRKNVNEK